MSNFNLESYTKTLKDQSIYYGHKKTNYKFIFSIHT